MVQPIKNYFKEKIQGHVFFKYLRVKTVETPCRFPPLNQSNDPQIHKDVMDSPKNWRIQPAKKKPRTTNMGKSRNFSPRFFSRSMVCLVAMHPQLTSKDQVRGVSPIFLWNFFLKFQQQKMQDIKRNSEL